MKTTITLITDYLKIRHYRVSCGGEWVMCSCPFAKWTHADGDDKKFSFGINVRGGYNCFTCGVKGSIYQLPWELSQYTRQNYSAMKEFIFLNWKNKPKYVPVKPKPVQVVFPSGARKLDREVLSLTAEDADRWDLFIKDDELLFPIYDRHRQCIAIKARMINEKRFYYKKEAPIKTMGIWYGEHLFWEEQSVFLVEGVRDAILLSRYYPVLASLGYPSKEQLSRLKRTTKRFVLFFDNDKAGMDMEKEVIRRLGHTNLLFKVIDYSGCKDPAEMVEQGLVRKVLTRKNIRRIV